MEIPYVNALSGALEFRPLTYGYANARVRAMRTLLLTRRQAEDLLKIKTASGVAEYLSRTHYRDEFSGMPRGITDEERVEMAVSRNFARTTRKLLAISPKKSRGVIRAFLGRYDIQNVKAILLSRRLGRAAEQARLLLVPAGSLSQAELERMLSAKSGEELYDALRATQFGSSFLSSQAAGRVPKGKLRAAFTATPEDSGAEPLLLALDTYYYEMASGTALLGDRDSASIVHMVRSQTDAKNALTIMRMKKGGAKAQEISPSLVTGGNFSQDDLSKMLHAKDVPAVAQLAAGFFISETGKGEFSAAEKRYREDGQLSHFEVVFENSLARRGLKLLRRSMMSLGTIVGFLFLKEEEMNNIRKIVRGHALGLAPERISEMLVLVG